MFTKRQDESALNAEIEAALKKLASLPDKTAEEYGNLVDHIAKLHKLKTEDRPKQITPDTVLVVAANLISILWLARYEREHVIKSKSAFGLVMKPR